MYPAWSIYLDDRFQKLKNRIGSFFGLCRKDQKYLYEKLVELNSTAIKCWDDLWDLRLTLQTIMRDTTITDEQKVAAIKRKLGL